MFPRIPKISSMWQCMSYIFPRNHCSCTSISNILKSQMKNFNFINWYVIFNVHIIDTHELLKPWTYYGNKKH